jgi:hypothetical protein
MAVLTGNGTAGAPSFTFTADTNCGIYRPNADQIGLAFAGVENARFTSSGLAVGASLTPIRQLQISPNTTHPTEANLVFYRPAGGTDEKYWRVYTDASTDYVISSMDDTFVSGQVGYVMARGVGVDVEYHAWYTTAAGPVALNRMFMEQSGRLNIYGTRTSPALSAIPGSGGVRITGNAPAGDPCLSLYDTQNFTAIQFVRDISGSAAQVGSIFCQDVAQQTTYNTSSDYRLKAGVVPLVNAIDRLKELQPKNFHWITDPDETVVDGFLAHEVDAVVPFCVVGEKDGMQTVTGCVLRPDGTIYASDVTEAQFQAGQNPPKPGRPVLYAEDMTWAAEVEVPKYQQIDHSVMVPLLTAALQEAVARIEALEAMLS